MRAHVARASFVVSAALLTSGCGDDRYEIEQSAKGGMICRLDTRSGEVICLDAFGRKLLTIPAGHDVVHIGIPEDDLGRIEFFVTDIEMIVGEHGHGLIWEGQDQVPRLRLNTLIYNPTDWRLRKVLIDVRGEESAPSRTYSAVIDIAPRTIGTFSIVVLTPKPAGPPPASLFDELLKDPLDTFGPVVKARLVSASGIRE